MNTLLKLLAPARAGTWWEFKTPIFLGVACLAAMDGGVPFANLWPKLIQVVVLLVPLASFVCVINDITDKREDLRARKTNTMAGRSIIFQAVWLFACILGGILAASFCFRSNTAALWLYAGNWLAFSLYSVPPIRLKTRGFPGVLADATGGQLLPTLWSALIVTPGLSPQLILLLAGWALCFGLRGILYHQAGDLKQDQAANVQTFAVRAGSHLLQRVVLFGVFPLELLAFGMLVAGSAPVLGAAALLLYLGFQFAMWRWLRVRLCVARPMGSPRMAMLKYYQFWFPLCMAVDLWLHDPHAVVLFPVFAVLFPGTWRRFFQHAGVIRRILLPSTDQNKRPVSR
jgi:4-hydroxybenzoate polyprenyltransferase